MLRKAILVVVLLAAAATAAGVLGGHRALPPRTVLSADVTNDATYAVRVTATYRWTGIGEAEPDRTVTHTIAPGETQFFETETTTRGLAQFAGDIQRFEVAPAVSTGDNQGWGNEVDGPYASVHGPTKHHKVTVSEDREVSRLQIDA